jgi:hypothetical protein
VRVFDGPEPTPPYWAIEAGLPEPEEGETFRAYVCRLGLDADELLEGLRPRTAVVANMRLAGKIADICPEAWDRHLKEFVKAYAKVTVASTSTGYSGESTL